MYSTKRQTLTPTLFPYTTLFRSKQIDVTITGTNDVPVITAQDLLGAVTELVTPAGNLSDTGTISFNDVDLDRKSTRLNSSHANISYAVFFMKNKNADTTGTGTGG